MTHTYVVFWCILTGVCVLSAIGVGMVQAWQMNKIVEALKDYLAHR